MQNEGEFRHLGGGRKGVFLLLRYLFIVAASYLLIFQSGTAKIVPSHALMVAIALASNVALSLAPAQLIFAWYVEAPVLVADTLWVSWAIHSIGSTGPEFFLLYFFVLFLAALGESLVMALLGSTLVSLANLYLSSNEHIGTTPHLLYVIFFYAVALFYGHVIGQIKRERQRADRGFAWARELDAKVQERTQALSHLYAETLAANRLKSEFLANMSHELRTPLSIIIGYADILLDSNYQLGGDERQEFLRRLRQAACDQVHLIDSVLDLGRIEAGKMPVENRPLRLDRYALDLQHRGWQPPTPQLILNWRVEPSLPVIETDVEKLNVILEHLIGNAIKFTPAGSVTITLCNHSDQRRVEFRVDDTGPGIAKENLPTIFEAFRQLDGSTSLRQEGLGIGLALVQRYVALLGGEVTVQSTLGTGSSFIVMVPHRASRPGTNGNRA